MTLLRLASRRTFASLRRHRNYRLFFYGQLTSVAGTWMQNIAMAWLVVQIAPTSRGLALGLLAACRFGPFTVLGLFSGVVTDRFDNRRVVMVTQAVQMVFSAVLAAITLLGHVQLWQVYVIAWRMHYRPPAVSREVVVPIREAVTFVVDAHCARFARICRRRAPH